jgi:hypothetical protein
MVGIKIVSSRQYQFDVNRTLLDLSIAIFHDICHVGLSEFDNSQLKIAHFVMTT